MKRILIAGLFLTLSSLAIAGPPWKSSTTFTNDGAFQPLCTKRAIFHGICTNFGVAAASTTIVASSFTYTTATGSAGTGAISTLVADQCKYYDMTFTNGMGYQKTNVANVTILYECY